jgi:hypothetical protein
VRDLWLVAAAVAACADYRDELAVTVRDPAQIAIAAAGETILPVGSDRAAIPPSAFLHDPLDDATVERGSDPVALFASCPGCRGGVRERVIGGCANAALVDDVATCLQPNPPTIDLLDTPAAVRVADGTLHLRYTVDDRLHEHRHSYRVPRIQLDLVTPTRNVVSIVASHRRAHPDRGLRISELVLGIVWVGLGATLSGLGIRDHDLGLEPFGVVLGGVGIGMVIDTWVDWHATDHVWTLPVQ